MEQITTRLAELLDQGQAVALATVVRTKGSVPREPGAQMLIHPAGQHLGTVGGGCGEAEVLRQALTVIADGQPRLLAVDLTEDISMQSLGICGGVLDVFLEVWPTEQRPLLAALLAAQAAGRPAALLTVITAPQAGLVGRKALWVDDELRSSLGIGSAEAVLAQAKEAVRAEQSRLLGVGEIEVFAQVLSPAPLLLIVGAGHIAVPLAQMAALCDFRVAVLDDRPSFAQAERFPQAERIIVGGYQEELRRFPIDDHTYIVLVTRGHQHDVPCLLEVLDSPAAYIGMIGSKRRVAGVFQLLEVEQGIARQKLARVHSPIGLSIGAETPAEIAVSILAELISVRRAQV